MSIISKIICFFSVVFLGNISFIAAQPIIDNFLPSYGPVGATVTITGTNFNANAANNIVFFGAVKATVSSATTNSIKVIVPKGATFQPISVTTSNLTAYSNKPFITTFAGVISSSSFAPKMDSITGNIPLSAAIGDLDGDGKIDVAVANHEYPYSISVSRNTSTDGNITFASKINITASSSPWTVIIGDVNGDGKPDMVVTNYDNHSVSIFKNTSSIGVISFASMVNYATGTNPIGVAIGDLDGDGRPDLATTNLSSHTISVFRNIGSNGTVSFEQGVEYGTGNNPFSIKIGDVNGDSQPEMFVTCSGSLSLFKNISAAGTIAFSTRVEYLNGISTDDVEIGDVDGDGKPDLTASRSNVATVFRNISTGGNISFATNVDFPTGAGPCSISLQDLDGDGRVDLTIANQNLNTVSVLKNNSSIGTISFQSKADFATGKMPRTISIGDIDGDGYPDLITSNQSSNTVSILKNIANRPTITSFSPVNAGTGSTVTIVGFNFSGATLVQFGGVLATSFTVVNSATITAVVGAGASGNVTVKTPAGMGTGAGFKFFLKPTVSSFTPTVALSGSMVTITGANFNGTTQVSFGGIPASSIKVVNATTIEAIVGAGASGYISVTTPGGTTTISGFTHTIPYPSNISFSPLSGPIGSTITIKGNNFSRTASDNIVYFGVTRAAVIASSDTTLTVMVPGGATYQPISVTTNNLTAYSAKAFNVTFGGTSINSHSFGPASDYKLDGETRRVATGDFNADGKTDLIVVSDGIWLYKNITENDSIFFAPKVNLSKLFTNDVSIGDIDGDGRLDIIAAGINVRVYKNTSNSNDISFDSPSIFVVEAPPQYNASLSCASIADLDGDGKLDLAVANEWYRTISLFRNTSAGTISFEPEMQLEVGVNPNIPAPTSVAIGDIDGDGKPDVVVANNGLQDHSVSIFKNLSITGTLSFASVSPLIPDINGYPSRVKLVDFDHDNRPELIISIGGTHKIVIYKNISSSTINFTSPIDYQAKADVLIGGFVVEDIDGDGKPDIVISNIMYDGTISVFKNVGTVANISFLANKDYPTSRYPWGIASGDFNADGKTDIVTTNDEGSWTPRSISIIRNTVDEPKITPSGANPVKGAIIKRTTIDVSVQTSNGVPYVQRHYDIEPTTNAATATATITLYFTQEEFDKYNSHAGHGFSLPTNPTDDMGKANIRIYQYHGFSATGMPGDYSGGGKEINPDDKLIVWNTEDLNWEVTFNVEGFSGFFLSSAGNNILPLHLLSFIASFHRNDCLLEWVTNSEINMDFFEVEKSVNGRDYTSIGKVAMNSSNKYSFTDNDPVKAINYYRLKMVDKDGSFEYSAVRTVNNNGSCYVSIYPNPAKENLNVKIESDKKETLYLEIIGLDGKILISKTVAVSSSTLVNINIKALKNGSYFLRVKSSGKEQTALRFEKL